jgi:hypothetical protein
MSNMDNAVFLQIGQQKSALRQITSVMESMAWRT